MNQKGPVKIIVVGCAADGMSAALRARRLDENASITLIEKGNYTSYANSGVPSSVGGVIETDTFLIHQSPAGLKDRFNLDVRDHTELVSVSREQHSILVRRSDANEYYRLPYDKLVLAQGAHPIQPRIHGIDGANAFVFQTMLDLERIKKYVSEKGCRSAAILGGGYLALKAVESLFSFGLSISIIHAQERICQDFDPDLANFVQSELTKNGIQLHLNANIPNIALGIAEDRCFVTLANEYNVPADLVVVATGSTPRIEIAKDSDLKCKKGVLVNSFMQTSDPDIYAVGDMAETENFIVPTSQMLPLSGLQSQQGRIAADHIMKRAVPYRGHIGTYSCKVLRLTAAIVGLSLERLKEIGYYPQSVTVHVPDHAGYYPSSQQMTLRLAFQPASGRLLSAQILGRSGVDRRIDVLSTALQAGMSVFDLELLELSYAPQYGSAKDPVNVVGMIASNLIRGDLRIVSPRDLQGHLQDWQMIDVRSPESFAQGHIPSALNVPIDTLRENLAYIDKQRPIVVYSRVGYHGYLAFRILVQLGYQVANLDGGLKLLVEGGFGIGLVSTGSE
jgi:NADPH-dependent 2,4-dienoyl-CoA reductase/sulfur reductase-like enzyme/rhodanese-related sulfurtransferase